MTYTQANEFLLNGRNKSQRKIGNIRSTQFIRRGDAIALRYHETDVVTLHPDGRATLNSGGWRTATTKDRINSYTGARIYQKNGTWYMLDGTPFYDGITIEGYWPDKMQKLKRQLKLIRLM